MFQVISKRTGITYDVYAVDSNRFLIFFNNNFTWQSMNDFRPIRTTEQERLKKNAIEKSTMFTRRSVTQCKPLYP